MFEVTSGYIIISDPCYEKELTNHGDLSLRLPAVNGQWQADTVLSEGRNAKLIAHVLGARAHRTEYYEVAVDSGQMGVYDEESYQNESLATPESFGESPIEWAAKEGWYGLNCNTTLKSRKGSILGRGYVATSGYGDGCYPCQVCFDKEGRAMHVEITFIGDNDDD